MSYCEIVSNSTRKGKQTAKVSKVSVKGPKIESDRVTKGERGPGRRRGRQDKPSGTEIYGACVRGRGVIRIQVRGQKGKEGYTDIRNRK